VAPVIGGLACEDIQAALRAPHLAQPAVITEACAASVQAGAAVIMTLNQQVKAMEVKVSGLFRRHPDAGIYLSQPGIGDITGARILGEFGDAPGRYATTKARKNYAGTSPLTIESGKKRTVHARYIRNRHLIDALHTQAFTASPGSPRLLRRTASPRYRPRRRTAPRRPAAWPASCTGVSRTAAPTTKPPHGPTEPGSHRPHDHNLTRVIPKLSGHSHRQTATSACSRPGTLSPGLIGPDLTTKAMGCLTSAVTESAGAEADEARLGVAFERRGECGSRWGAARDRAVVPDHGGHRGVVGDPGDAGDDGRGARVQQCRDDAERLVAGPDVGQPQIAGGQHDHVRYLGQPLQVIAEQRPSVQVQGGEQRVLGLMMAVRGDVHYSRRVQRGQGRGGCRVRAGEDAGAGAERGDRRYLRLAAGVAGSGNEQVGTCGPGQPGSRWLAVRSRCLAACHAVADGATVTGRPVQPGSTAHGTVVRMPVGTTTRSRSPTSASSGVSTAAATAAGVLPRRCAHGRGELAWQRAARLDVEVGAQPQHGLRHGGVPAHRPQPRRVTDDDKRPERGAVPQVDHERRARQLVADRADGGGRGGWDITPPRGSPRLLADGALEGLDPGGQAMGRLVRQLPGAQRVPGLPQFLQRRRGGGVVRRPNRRQQQGLGPGAFRPP